MANEKRLIDANALMKAIKSFRWFGGYPPNTLKLMFDYLKIIIDGQPTVDAVEVVHAHWGDGCAVDCYGNIAYKSIDCSHCNEIFKIDSRTREYWKARFKVCPFCGAKMDGGNEDG